LPKRTGKKSICVILVILHNKKTRKNRKAHVRQSTAFWSLSSPKSHKMSVCLAFQASMQLPINRLFYRFLE